MKCSKCENRNAVIEFPIHYEIETCVSDDIAIAFADVHDERARIWRITDKRKICRCNRGHVWFAEFLDEECDEIIAQLEDEIKRYESNPAYKEAAGEEVMLLSRAINIVHEYFSNNVKWVGPA